MKKYLLPFFFLVFASSAFPQIYAAKGDPPKPNPDIADGRYGPLERNIFDLWKPRSKKPTPLVVFIHGGGFVDGSKEKLSPILLKRMLDAGFAVMAVNYSLLKTHPLPQAYLDCARAIQYARSSAKKWNVDKKKIAAIGSSAGALTSLWLAFHDDLADKRSNDPVLRESTRLKAVAVWDAQTTLDLDLVKARIGPATAKHYYYNGRLFGLKPEEMSTEKAIAMAREASPLDHVSKDDPPVWMYYTHPAIPQTDATTSDEAIHHQNYGVLLKEALDRLKIENHLHNKTDGISVVDDFIAFLSAHLR